MQDDDEACEECEAGAPAWLATFADLMSLLMCFFVLLLSFSEMDLQKYKQVAGSMKFAFGVQKKIKADDIPKGTSIIMKEFTPGKPDPSIVKRIEQFTPDDSDRTVHSPLEKKEELEELINTIEFELFEEIEAEVFEVLIYEDGVMLRVREQDAFPSGSAELQSRFLPVLEKLVDILDSSTGRIVVSGHTDDMPISTSIYPSNWVLSSARAASVVHFLSTRELSDPGRIELRAFADTQPIVENTSPENRARNRRVEISISL